MSSKPWEVQFAENGITTDHTLDASGPKKAGRSVNIELLVITMGKATKRYTKTLAMYLIRNTTEKEAFGSGGQKTKGEQSYLVLKHTAIVG